MKQIVCWTWGLKKRKFANENVMKDFFVNCIKFDN